MSILLTGGAGYIGSHTCLELLNNKDNEVIVTDNLSNSNQIALKRVEELTGKRIKFEKIDLLDTQELIRVFSENNIKAVIHFAGLKSVGESVQNPLYYYHNNIAGTISLCNVMKKFSVRKLVFSSSATVYGLAQQSPISESTPLNATNPYGRTKLIIEEILRDLYESDKEWSIALLRYFNPIGAHKSGLIGEDPNGIPNNLTPYITQVAVGKLNELRIFGDDYDTIDGTGVRDYIHVVDLAKGHLKALDKVMKSTGIEAYNLGTGKGYSVLEVLRAFEKATGKDIPYKIVDRRPGDVAVSYADPTKAKNDLGWKAEKEIDQMCVDAWNWQMKNVNGYKTEELMK
ncbi:UDP-glucose 4-epimerase [Fictibacillus solisalsi]|uniref:UDP-glucose 4-epimerase n=1 Tax=Fictibacillus solisalsi TaxID=459525 RepID=A0A1G9YIJ8_9BACL|nr:UDP-glucose 4-epimerase GalE [Fictibacillus solisalsi]SDN09009.1 UDP-glucose 4-epimerase [Fictibacillus solisalsi]